MGFVVVVVGLDDDQEMMTLDFLLTTKTILFLCPKFLINSVGIEHFTFLFPFHSFIMIAGRFILQLSFICFYLYLSIDYLGLLKFFLPGIWKKKT